MIRNERLFREWEDRWLAGDKLSLERKFRLLDGMYDEARALGIFPAKDPLEGLDFKIKLAREMNVRRAA